MHRHTSMHRSSGSLLLFSVKVYLLCIQTYKAGCKSSDRPPLSLLSSMKQSLSNINRDSAKGHPANDWRTFTLLASGYVPSAVSVSPGVTLV